MTRPRIAIAGAMLAVVGWGGCRSSPQPDVLFSEAEHQRLRYEKAASHEAIAKYREAIKVWERQGQRRSAARAWQRVGQTYEQLGSLEESLRAYQAALPLLDGVGEPLLESEIGSEAGVAQAYSANHTRALDTARRHCEKALALARQADGRREIGNALDCLGEVVYVGQDPKRALEFYREAEAAFRTPGDDIGNARTQLNQGHAYSDLGELDKAQACLDRAEALWARIGDKRQQAIVRVAKARLEVRRGNYERALNQFQGALTSLEPMGDAVWEGSSLTGIARVYEELGETGLALKHRERALRLFDSAGLKTFAPETLASLGRTYLASGNHLVASKHFERVLALADELGIERYKALALRYLGVVHLVRREADLARQYFDRASEVQRRGGHPRLDRWLPADFGETLNLERHYDAAARRFEKALALSRSTGDRVTEARALFGLAAASSGAKDLDNARTYIERALSISESLRSGVDNQDLRASYLASVYGYRQLHVAVLAELHKLRPREGLSGKAFDASERARARSLLESLVDSGVDLRPGTTDTERLSTEYRGLEHRYQQIQTQLPQPLTLRQIQTAVLDRDTVLLEYALGDERSYLWVVSHDAHVLQELPPGAKIEALAQEVYERLIARLASKESGDRREAQIRQADEEFWQEAARLSDMLLAPVLKRIAGKRLLVVADGALQYVPFSALPVPGRGGDPVPLLVEHEIVTLPSASVLGVLRRETQSRPEADRAVAVFADPVFEVDDPRLRTRGRADGKSDRWPRLPATRHEADAIIAAAPAGLMLKKTGFDASRAAALEPGLSQYRIVHFATHGIVDNENPGLSGLILSLYDEKGQAQDGFLRLHDIYNLRLPAELVVLSACSTALGKQVKGEGLTGMVRGFFYAGAKRVVASLWKVDDEATSELMQRFYVEMLQAKRSPAAALREAQLAMWRQDRWRAPFYWAAFSLQGEWR